MQNRLLGAIKTALASPGLRHEHALIYLLGVVGWIIILKEIPFDWVLPSYAEF